VKLVDAARSLPGRLLAVALGVTGVTLIVRGLGADAVGHAIEQASRYMPLVIMLEVGVLACTLGALRSLYGDAAKQLPMSQLIRAGLIGYAVMGLVPAGRAAAEIARASIVARWVGAGTAGAAAARVQAVALVANACISFPAALAAWSLVGANWLPLTIALNGVVTLALGGSVLFFTKRSRIGAWLARRSSRVEKFGAELDDAFAREPALPVRAIAWEFGGRLVQLAQNAVLVACVGGVVGLPQALTSQGIHLVGAAVGDLIPAQLGATEGNYTLAANALGLTAAAAVSIALLAHLAQLFWVGVGTLVPLVWRPPGGSASVRAP
jgi:hypothetical protein